MEIRRKALGRLGRALLLAAFGCGPALAATDFEGYFRVGPGSSTSSNAARACYDLPIDGGHYRLGNECDRYGQFALIQRGKAETLSYNLKLMISEWLPLTNNLGKGYKNIKELYAEGRGFDLAPNLNFWIGKRSYGSTDIHILDTFVTNLDGNGTGVEDIPLAGGKLNLSFFTTDADPHIYGIQTDFGNEYTARGGLRLNADLKELAVNSGGTLRLLLAVTQGRFDGSYDGSSNNGTKGVAVTLQHTQEVALLGATNNLWLQHARGSAALNGNFGALAAPFGVTKSLLFDSLTWEKGRITGQAVAALGRYDHDPSTQTPQFSEYSLGGRLSYAFSHHFKMLGELGYMVKKPLDGPAQKLAKITLAPTLSLGMDFYDRPELRFYITHAQWNAAANSAAGPGGLTGIGDGATKGTSFGAQIEVWF